MPLMKKGRKPRPKKTQRAISASDAKAIPQPPREEVRRRLIGALARIVTIAGGAGALLGLLAAIIGWWPKISVEPSAAADLVSNPLSGEPVAKLFGTPLITPLKTRQCI